jgi:hypothetical protein
MIIFLQFCKHCHLLESSDKIFFYRFNLLFACGRPYFLAQKVSKNIDGKNSFARPGTIFSLPNDCGWPTHSNSFPSVWYSLFTLWD